MYFKSCGTNNSINKTFIIEPLHITGNTESITACTEVITNKIVSCSGDTEIHLTSGSTIFNTDIIPTTDNTISIGYPHNRFRDINTYSGSTSIWSADTRVETPELHLGDDSSGNTRTITADNSIIQDDILSGGTY